MDTQNCQIFKSHKYSARERQKDRNGRLMIKIKRDFGFIGDIEERQETYQEVWTVLKAGLEDWSKIVDYQDL